MKIYIVRHGEVPHNALKQYNTKDEDLTELGISQAEELRDKIKDINFDIIISSPLIRAKHTANIINANNNEIIIDDRIQERSCGDLTMILSCVKMVISIILRLINNISISFTNMQVNIKNFFDRIYNFLDELKTQNYKSVLIVAHSGVSKAFSAYFDGISDGWFLNRGLKNCEIKEYKL